MQRHWPILFVFFFYGCGPESIGQRNNTVRETGIINTNGNTLRQRINPPEGYKRIAVTEHSFAQYLRNIPLHSDGHKVRYYDGSLKANEVYAAVIKMDVGDKDLQQCADAIMRLRAEYLFKNSHQDQIHFNFTNGFRADYSKWREGYRIAVNGNRARWVRSAQPDHGYTSFRNYMDMVFNYAGTLSLSKELAARPLKELQPGDVLIQGGSPGHAVIVMDVALDNRGRKAYLLAQSYMPAQEIHVLKNVNDPHLSPWYIVDENESSINTPEWTFTAHDLKRFKEE